MKIIKVIVFSFIILFFFSPIRSFANSSYSLQSPIKSFGVAPSYKMKRLVLSRNKDIDNDILNYIIRLYIKESKMAQVNHDIAFVQMILETNFLQYGNDARESQNNFAGIGVVGNGVRGHIFTSILTGIRAHIQHLAAYAHTLSINKAIVDPRFSYVKRGSAPRLKNLTKKWATDPRYSYKLLNLLKRLNSH